MVEQVTGQAAPGIPRVLPSLGGRGAGLGAGRDLAASARQTPAANAQAAARRAALKAALPAFLWHGVDTSKLASILARGLEPRSTAGALLDEDRPYLALTSDPQIALCYGRLRAVIAGSASDRVALIRIPTHLLDLDALCLEFGSLTISAYGQEEGLSASAYPEAVDLLRAHRVIGTFQGLAVDPTWVDLSWTGIDLSYQDALDEVKAEFSSGRSAFFERFSAARPAAACRIADFMPAEAAPEALALAA